MEYRVGDHVAQPGSVHRIGDGSKQSVPCRVSAVDGIHVEVCSEYPCREVAVWVLSSWIEEVVVSATAPAAS